MWQDRRILDLFGIDHPLLLAPMAGSAGSALAVAVAKAGALAALPCALLSPDQMRAEIGVIREQALGPLNLNFFCHTPPQPDPAREQAWRTRIAALYGPIPEGPDAPLRRPFDEAACAVVDQPSGFCGKAGILTERKPSFAAWRSRPSVSSMSRIGRLYRFEIL